jgi:hypothetical protein
MTRLRMAAQLLEISQCEMPVRDPTKPETAMIAHRTPRACSGMACISSTLLDMPAISPDLLLDGHLGRADYDRNLISAPA